MKSVDTQSHPLPTLLPFLLTEWLVPYAQTIAHDCLALFAFKGRNARRRKAIVLEVHSTPGALKGARGMCGFAITHALFINFKDLIPHPRSFTTASFLYLKMPAAKRNTTPVQCTNCNRMISRQADLPRHMRTHDEHKESLMHACSFPGCDYKTLQKSNVRTHMGTHTRERSKTCPHPGCPFAANDPASLTRHRKQLHGYKPKARCSPGGKAARRSVAAPYPSARFIMPEVEIPTSMNFNDPTFPELAGLIPCDALSPAESSDSGIPQFSGEFTELTWERLFPDISAKSFASVYDQPSQFPIPTSNYFQPPPVPVDLSTLHMPQFDPALFSDVKYQQPVPDVNFQSQPVFGNDLNNSLPSELDEFLLKYGSGFFEGRCGYQDNSTYSMTQPSFTNEYNV